MQDTWLTTCYIVPCLIWYHSYHIWYTTHAVYTGTLSYLLLGKGKANNCALPLLEFCHVEVPMSGNHTFFLEGPIYSQPATGWQLTSSKQKTMLERAKNSAHPPSSLLGYGIPLLDLIDFLWHSTIFTQTKHYRVQLCRNKPRLCYDLCCQGGIFHSQMKAHASPPTPASFLR